MQAIIKSSCIIGLSLITSGLGMNYARADFGLQVDFSGTNVWNSPASTLVEQGSQISPEMIETARQLSQELENAYIECDDARNEDLGARKKERSCWRLVRVREEVNELLSRIERNREERLRRDRSLRIW